MQSLFPETNGDDNVIDFKQYHFIDVSRSRVIVPAGARLTHISATIDGKEVCSAPLKCNLHSETMWSYELQSLHPYFINIPLMHKVPMVIKITSSAPIMVEAQCMFFTDRVALKLKPYAKRMWDENDGRIMLTHEELHKLLQ